MFDFSSVVLEFGFAQTLKHCLILKGFITKYSDGHSIADDEFLDSQYYFTGSLWEHMSKVERIEAMYNDEFKHLYQLLVLSENIIIPATPSTSAWHPGFDESNIAEFGVEFVPLEKSYKEPEFSFFQFDIGISSLACSKKKEWTLTSNDEVNRIMSMFWEEIFTQYIQSEYSKFVDKRKIDKDWCKYVYMNILKGNVNDFDGFESSLSRYITDFSYNILYGIKKDKHTFYAPFCSNAQGKLYAPLDSQFIKATNQIAKVRLNNEVNIIPAPQSIEEVLKMRKDPTIVSFRTVLAEWSEYFSKGEWRLAAKMQNDLIKANKALTKLNHYKETKESPYFAVGSFIVGFIAEFIPGLSPVLNVVDLASYFVEKQKEKKYSWILMSTIDETYKPQK